MSVAADQTMTFVGVLEGTWCLVSLVSMLRPSVHPSRV